MERRGHPRFKAIPGAFAVLRDGLRLGQIEDISLGGLAFCYVPLEYGAAACQDLEIHYVKDGFRLARVPFRVISDRCLSAQGPFNYVETWRCGLRFGALTPLQHQLVVRFISRYTGNGNRAVPLPRV